MERVGEIVTVPEFERLYNDAVCEGVLYELKLCVRLLDIVDVSDGVIVGVCVNTEGVTVPVRLCGLTEAVILLLM
jgi:hypothetical protein